MCTVELCVVGRGEKRRGEEGRGKEERGRGGGRERRGGEERELHLYQKRENDSIFVRPYTYPTAKAHRISMRLSTISQQLTKE